MTEATIASRDEAQTQQARDITAGSFQLKASRLTLTMLELYDYDYTLFNQQMAKVLQQAPNFFDQTPVVITLDKVTNKEKIIDFIELTQMCQEYGVFPVAVKGGTEEMQLSALAVGLPHIPTAPSRYSEDVSLKESQTETQAHAEANSAKTSPDAAKNDQELSFKPSKVIRRPVRSGQQIYASGCDLIILAPVSTGAEVLADGNIHCYAPLRGRALAGIRGNKEAQIFCQTLEAELISIAGHYKVSDDLQKSGWGESIQAYLDGSHLKTKVFKK